MYKLGDIVLVKMHPSSGQELKQFRPATVLYEQANRGFTTFIPLTNQTKIYSADTEFLVKPTNLNGLEKPSLLLCWYVQTVGNHRIQKTIGKLSKDDLNRIAKAMKKIIPL